MPTGYLYSRTAPRVINEGGYPGVQRQDYLFHGRRLHFSHDQGGFIFQLHLFPGADFFFGV